MQVFFHTSLCIVYWWAPIRTLSCVGAHYLENMSLRAFRCIRSSWLLSCKAGRKITAKQFWREGRRGIEGLRTLSVSARLCGEDKVTHTGQVRTRDECLAIMHALFYLEMGK